jgi:hypothetical protein
VLFADVLFADTSFRVAIFAKKFEHNKGLKKIPFTLPPGLGVATFFTGM